ncbi:MAG: AMP-binding protein [Phycisphaeraceae bacterium]|nr:AMP-binding protein [Phycisphaeraceae bacterium]
MLKIRKIWPFFRKSKEVSDDSRPLDYSAHYEAVGVPSNLHYPATTLGEVLDQTARRYGDNPAVIYGPTTLTYKQLRKKVDRTAAGLVQLGVRPGDRVVLTLPNCTPYMVLFLAVQKIGAVVVNAGPLMGKDDLKKLLTMTEPTAVVGLDLQSEMLADAGAELIDVRWIWVSLAEYIGFWKRLGYHVKRWSTHPKIPEHQEQTTLEKMRQIAPSRPPSIDPKMDDVALLQPTGGTTGVLKVAQLTHRNLLANAAQTTAWTGLRSGQESVLGILPMFHVYGLSTCLVNVIYNGAAVILMTRFRAQALIEKILKHRPSVLPLVPAIIDAVCDEVEGDAELQEKLRAAIEGRLVLSGAAPLPAGAERRFEQLFGSRIVQGYGLTEASPVTHLNPIDRPRTSSIGLPLPDTLVRIMDLSDKTKAAASGESGELLISGPQVMVGYLGGPDANENMFSVDETGRRWLHTGDVVRVDGDGYFFVVDREKDMINRAGLKVWPAKVERVLRMSPRVRDVAVVGVKDETHTEAVVAYIVAETLSDDPQNTQLATELRSLSKEHLAPYEVPGAFEFVKELPRSGLGKMLKHRLGEADSKDREKV